MTQDEVPATTDAERAKAQAIVLAALDEYAQKRIQSYRDLHVARLLSKALLMMVMRGAATSADLLETAFSAFESSSEETQWGHAVQRIAIELAERAVDSGDLVMRKDGDLWVVEMKSQIDTTTGGFVNDLARKLKRRVDALKRPRRVTGGRVRALLGVIRGAPRDTEITLRFNHGHDYADLDNFSYSYKVGKPFWEWLTGRPGIESLVDAVPGIAADVAAAREECRVKLHAELEEALAARGPDRSALSVLRLADEQYR